MGWIEWASMASNNRGKNRTDRWHIAIQPNRGREIESDSIYVEWVLKMTFGAEKLTFLQLGSQTVRKTCPTVKSDCWQQLVLFTSGEIRLQITQAWMESGFYWSGTLTEMGDETVSWWIMHRSTSVCTPLPCSRSL